MADHAREQQQTPPSSSPAGARSEAPAQPHPRSREESPEAMAQRIAELEGHVDALVQALQVLIEGIEPSPVQHPGDSRAARGARLARELLLARGLWSA